MIGASNRDVLRGTGSVLPFHHCTSHIPIFSRNGCHIAPSEISFRSGSYSLYREKLTPTFGKRRVSIRLTKSQIHRPRNYPPRSPDVSGHYSVSFRCSLLVSLPSQIVADLRFGLPWCENSRRYRCITTTPPFISAHHVSNSSDARSVLSTSHLCFHATSPNLPETFSYSLSKRFCSEVSLISASPSCGNLSLWPGPVGKLRFWFSNAINRLYG